MSTSAASSTIEHLATTTTVERCSVLTKQIHREFEKSPVASNQSILKRQTNRQLKWARFVPSTAHPNHRPTQLRSSRHSKSKNELDKEKNSTEREEILLAQRGSRSARTPPFDRHQRLHHHKHPPTAPPQTQPIPAITTARPSRHFAHLGIVPQLVPRPRPWRK